MGGPWNTLHPLYFGNAYHAVNNKETLHVFRIDLFTALYVVFLVHRYLLLICKLLQGTGKVAPRSSSKCNMDRAAAKNAIKVSCC